jgi:hypothetical protein
LLTVLRRSISSVMKEQARRASCLAETLRRRADDGQRVAHLVRDRRCQLAERGKLLALCQTRAHRVDRLQLFLNDGRLLPVTLPSLGEVTEKETEERERAAEIRCHRPPNVGAVHLEGDPELSHPRGVQGTDEQAGEESPPAGAA